MSVNKTNNFEKFTQLSQKILLKQINTDINNINSQDSNNTKANINKLFPLRTNKFESYNKATNHKKNTSSSSALRKISFIDTKQLSNTMNSNISTAQEANTNKDKDKILNNNIKKTILPEIKNYNAIQKHSKNSDFKSNCKFQQSFVNYNIDTSSYQTGYHYKEENNIGEKQTEETRGKNKDSDFSLPINVKSVSDKNIFNINTNIQIKIINNKNKKENRDSSKFSNSSSKSKDINANIKIRADDIIKQTVEECVSNALKINFNPQTNQYKSYNTKINSNLNLIKSKENENSTNYNKEKNETSDDNLKENNKHWFEVQQSIIKDIVAKRRQKSIQEKEKERLKFKLKKEKDLFMATNNSTANPDITNSNSRNTDVCFCSNKENKENNKEQNKLSKSNRLNNNLLVLKKEISNKVQGKIESKEDSNIRIRDEENLEKQDQFPKDNISNSNNNRDCINKHNKACSDINSDINQIEILRSEESEKSNYTEINKFKNNNNSVISNKQTYSSINKEVSTKKSDNKPNFIRLYEKQIKKNIKNNMLNSCSPNTKRNTNITDINKLVERLSTHSKMNYIIEEARVLNRSLSPNILSKKNLLKAYSTIPTYYFFIHPENNGILVKNCFKHRINWKETKLSNNHNFRWKDTSKDLDFTNLVRGSNMKLMYNHFEFHSQISNKMKLFINLMIYCEKNSLQLFKYIPITVCLRFNSGNFLEVLSNFEEFYSISNDIVFDIENTKLTRNDKIKKYSNYFDLSQYQKHLGVKTICFIPPSTYDFRNIWLVKAIDLNRGRGIKLCRTFESISRYIKRVYDGLDLELKQVEEENVNNELMSSDDEETNKYMKIKKKKNKENKVNCGFANKQEFNQSEESNIKRLDSLELKIDRKVKDIKLPLINTNITTNNNNKNYSDDIKNKDYDLTTVSSQLNTKSTLYSIPYLSVTSSSIAKNKDSSKSNTNTNNFQLIKKLSRKSINSDNITHSTRKNKSKKSKKNKEKINTIVNQLSNFDLKLSKIEELKESIDITNLKQNQQKNSNFNVKNKNYKSNSKRKPSKLKDKTNKHKKIDNIIKSSINTHTNNTVNVNTNSTNSYNSGTVILQKYIEKPFLYQSRKMDIRVWVLITQKLQVYVFKEGHLKTCSYNYSLDDKNNFVHLTNYSLQKYSNRFGANEVGNEVFWQDFQNELDLLGRNITIAKDVFPKIKELVKHTTKAVKNKINYNERKYSFEIFGFDFMMDQDLNVFLLEVNTNPGLDFSSPGMNKILPRLMEDCLRLTIDDVFDTEFEDGKYTNPFSLDGYSDEENVWDYVCSLTQY